MTRPQDMLRDGPGGAVLNSLSPFLLPSRRCGGTGRGGTLFCAPSFPETFAGIRLASFARSSLTVDLDWLHDAERREQIAAKELEIARLEAERDELRKQV